MGDNGKMERDISWREWYEKQWRDRWYLQGPIMLSLQFCESKPLFGHALIKGLAGMEDDFAHDTIPKDIWKWMDEIKKSIHWPTISLEAIKEKPINAFYYFNPSFEQRVKNRMDALYSARPTRHDSHPFEANAVISNYQADRIYKSDSETDDAHISEPVIYCRVSEGIHRELTSILLKKVFCYKNSFFAYDQAQS